MNLTLSHASFPDLLAAIAYSMRHEVALHRAFDGEVSCVAGRDRHGMGWGRVAQDGRRWRDRAETTEIVRKSRVTVCA